MHPTIKCYKVLLWCCDALSCGHVSSFETRCENEAPHLLSDDLILTTILTTIKINKMGFNVLFSDLKVVIKINIPIRKVFPALKAKNWQCSEKFSLLENTLLGLDESGAWVEAQEAGHMMSAHSLWLLQMTRSVLTQAQRAVTDSVLTSFCLMVSIFIRTSSEQNSLGLRCAYLQLISSRCVWGEKKIACNYFNTF